MGGIGIYGVISVCLFFAVFGTAMLWASRLKKPFLKSMGALPLQDENPAAVEKGENRHD
jgi:hypothetical protein